MELNNYSNAAHKDNFFLKLLTRSYIFQLTKYGNDSVSKSIDSDDRNFSFIGQRLPTLDAYSFGLTMARNLGPTTMEYLSFWLIYILIWCNLCISCVNGNNLKTAHSKMVFWDSLKKHWLKQNFNVWIASTTTKKGI